MENVARSIERIDEWAKGQPDVNLQPGHFKVSHCTLHHGRGTSQPIGDLITKIHLFESLDSTGITGWIDMEDDINLVEGGLIVGEELLYLRFETAGATEAGVPEFAVDFTKHPLAVYGVQDFNLKVDAQNRTTPKMLYRLHFCSPELLKNQRIKISRTFNGKYSDIIKKVLGRELGSIKKLFVEPTLDLKHIIAPNIRPFDFIKTLVPQARAKDQGEKPDYRDIMYEKRGKLNEEIDFVTSYMQIFKGSRTDYMFFETTRGYHFRPLSTPQYAGLQFTINPIGAADPGGLQETAMGSVDAFMRAINFKMAKTGNKLSTTSSGAWASNIINFDPIKKIITKHKSDYLKQLYHKKYGHSSETPSYEPKGIGKPPSEWDDSSTRFAVVSSNTECVVNWPEYTAMYPWSSTSKTQALHRQMQTNHLLGYQRLELELHGMSGLQVGMAARCEWPDLGLLMGQLGTQACFGSSTPGPIKERVWENRNSNIWIVTKVAHEITVRGTKPNYITRIELANSMSETKDPLPVWGQLGEDYGTIATEEHDYVDETAHLSLENIELDEPS